MKYTHLNMTTNVTQMFGTKWETHWTCFSWSLINKIWRAPKLLNRLKCESKVKTTKEQGVGARSMVRNALGGVEGHVRALGWD
jgi:hypothetical protein